MEELRRQNEVLTKALEDEKYDKTVNWVASLGKAARLSATDEVSGIEQESNKNGSSTSGSENNDQQEQEYLPSTSRTMMTKNTINKISKGINSETGYDSVMQTLYDEVIKLDNSARSMMVSGWLNIPVYQSDGKTADGFDSYAFSFVIAYQGFKPFDMACLIMKRMKKSGGTKHDIHRLVQLGSERGNNLEKMTKGASKEFLDILKQLKTTYCLKSKAGKNPHAITQSRVCMTFPHIACSFAKINRNPIVSGDALDAMDVSYPRVMMTSAFGSIIPNNHEEYCKIINAFYI